jgi:hypothetical protein
LLLRGLPGGQVSDRLWFVSSARRGSLLYLLARCGVYAVVLSSLAT